MAKGGISKRIVGVAEALVGYIYGGLPCAGALACAFFGAISGSANATAAAIGGIIMPSMLERGYNKTFTSTFMAASSLVGVLIPPSIPVILYCAASGTSIGKGFISTIIPGILIVFGLSVYAHFYSKKRKVGRAYEKFSLRELYVKLKEGALALGMPAIILGGVFGGVFTATEAAAVGVLYGIIVAVFIYKELSIKEMIEYIGEQMITCSSITIILMCAGIFGWVLIANRIPQTIVKMMLGISGNWVVIMLIINLLLLFLGTFMECVAAIVMVTPLLLPVVTALGLSPLYFCAILVTNLAIGMITPPLGVVLFLTCGMNDTTVRECLRDLVPVLLIEIAVLLLITFVPALCTALPEMLYAQ